MAVGGRLIEIATHILRDVDSPEYRRDVIRLWVIDRDGDETIAYAEPAEEMPRLGENIWWQAGKIFFDSDRKYLVKIANSHRVF